MRILLLAHGLPPASVGGVEQHVAGLGAALVAAGHEVDYWARDTMPGEPQGTWRLLRSGNPAEYRVAYRWEGVDSLAAMYECAPMAAALAGFLAAQRAAGICYDVAHVHHLTGMSVRALDALAAAGVPTVMTLHDYWLLCPRGQMFHRNEEACATAPPARCGPCLAATFSGWFRDGDRTAPVERLQAEARRLLALPQRLVLPSRRMLPPFAALGIDEQRFTVVENGVDVDRLAALPPPAAGPGPLRLGFFGTLLPSKGLHVLLDALARLPAGLVELHIHGNAAPYHGDVSYLNRCFQGLRPDSGVTWFGPYSLGDLPRRLAAIDVLAAPALWHEAFGLTVREALAAGRPVLVSRIGGLQDAVVDGEQGLVLPPGSAAAWAAAIDRLARDRAAVHRLARGARSRARGFGAMTAELLGVYAAARAACAGDRLA